MAKRRSVKNSDISNWMVVVMLVAVILVSTFSIIMFLDAAEEAAPEIGGTGVVSLTVEKPSETVPVSSEKLSLEGSEVSLTVDNPEE